MRLGTVFGDYNRTVNERYRGDLVLNEENLDRCILYFQKTCLPYWESLKIKEPSHLKVFGYLLYCLTQLRDPSTKQRLAFCGMLSGSGKPKTEFEDDDYLRVHFNEFAAFNIVSNMLVSAQRRRDATLKFDGTKPPTNTRYTRSMIDYLRQWDEGPLVGDRIPYDFYMVFKTMDLYGVENAYDK